MAASDQYASFLLRLWYEQSGETPTSSQWWHSEVQHIQSGQLWSFATIDELLDFLRRYCEGSLFHEFGNLEHLDDSK